jgi:hypothetical protein
MTPSLPTTGPGDEPKRCCRSTSPPDSSTEPRTYAARSATAPCSPTRTDPAPHANGSTGWPPLARRSSRLGHSQPGHRFTPSHPPPLQPHPPATRACSSRMPGDWHVRFLGGPASQDAGPTCRCTRSGAAWVGAVSARGVVRGLRAAAPAGLTLPNAVLLLQPLFKCWTGRCRTCHRRINVDRLTLALDCHDE